MTDTTQLFLVHRRIKLRGTTFEPGDVVDLAPLDLPQGRAQQLVDQRRGELVTTAGDTAAPDTAQHLIESWAVSGGATETVDDPVDDLGATLGSELSAPLPNGGLPPAETLTRMSGDELRDLARRCGVPIRGSKSDIIQRLTGAATPS